MDLIENTKEIQKYLRNEINGSEPNQVIAISGSVSYLNEIKMPTEGAINILARNVGNIVTSNSTCYTERNPYNGEKREYKDFSEIKNQKADDYVKINALNFLTLAKAMAQKSVDEKSDKVYIAVYDANNDEIEYETFETLDDIEQVMENIGIEDYDDVENI